MPRKFISQLNGGTTIDEMFLVQNKDLRTTKNGSLYIQVQLSDRTGMIVARMWDASTPFFESLGNDTFLRIKGRTEIYQNRLKVVTENGWFAARPSGTEDIYKIYAESFRGIDHLRNIQEEAQTIVNAAFKTAGL